MDKLHVVLISLYGALAVNAAVAHHSAPAHYDMSASATIRGIATEFLFRNPHSVIYVEVVNESGEPEVWAVEWHNTIIMQRQGYAPDTIKPGDELVVEGYPGRDASRRLLLDTLRRPVDGFVAADQQAER